MLPGQNALDFKTSLLLRGSQTKRRVAVRRAASQLEALAKRTDAAGAEAHYGAADTDYRRP